MIKLFILFVRILENTKFLDLKLLDNRWDKNY